MARWRLITGHHLYIKGIEWEYKEVDRTTGKQIRRTFPVPQHLDPNEPSDWTHKEGKDAGYICVCLPGKGEAKDLEFFSDPKYSRDGQPTPDMEPLDDEAKAITAKLEEVWKRGPVLDSDAPFAAGLVEQWQKDLAKLQVNSQPAAQIEGISELLGAITAMMKQNQDMMMLIAGPKLAEAKADPKAAAARRA